MREEGRNVGRFDSRITGVDETMPARFSSANPSFDIVHGVYSACLNDFVRGDLAFESDLPYEILSFKVLPEWNYDEFQNSYVNTAETLRSAMGKNPALKVFVANGLYDLATPFFATEYTIDHLGLRDGLQEMSDGLLPGRTHDVCEQGVAGESFKRPQALRQERRLRLAGWIRRCRR
ncbi:MAG: hypothetical protein U5O39_05695 [Gammaproteobacteria bacterium]|nr:hypothetical protein [Gammaproteobacteria bacterium]